MIYILYYIRKIQDTDDWTLMAVLLMGSFTSILIKPETCFYTPTPLDRTGINVQNQRCERLG